MQGFLSHRCASNWTRPSGGGRWEHYLCNLQGECLAAHKLPVSFFGMYVGLMIWEPYMQASAGQPSLQGYDACIVYWTEGALRRICRQKYGKTSFSPLWVFLFSRNSRERFWGLILWCFWIGRARHPGPTSLPAPTC